MTVTDEELERLRDLSDAMNSVVDEYQQILDGRQPDTREKFTAKDVSLPRPRDPKPRPVRNQQRMVEPVDLRIRSEMSTLGLQNETLSLPGDEGVLYPGRKVSPESLDLLMDRLDHPEQFERHLMESIADEIAENMAEKASLAN